MARELAITGLRAIASQRGYVIAAGAGGKVKTALQLVGITFLLVHFEYEILFVRQTLDFHTVGINLLYVSLVLSITSAAEYFRFFARAAAQQAREMEEAGITRAKRKEQLRKRRKKLVAARVERRRKRQAEKRERRAEKRAK